MRIAVSSSDNRGLEGQVSQHFGRCPYFTFVNVEDGEIRQVDVLDNPFYDGHQPGQIPGFVHQQGGTMIIAGGMGGRAVEFFEQLGIQPFTGAAGSVKHALELALGGELSGAMPCPGHGEGECDDHEGDHHGHHHA
jgi:predicted Fe-Mo cluster-binding NifX family protein